jgi:predicted Zn-dependent protease
MTRWLAFSGILAMGLAAIVVSERRKVDVPANPAPLLYLVADTEQELTRMPASFTRMSDREEIRIGDELARSYSGIEPEDHDPEKTEIAAYIARVGASLAVHAHRKLPYKFHYIPDKSFVNAFALPGGHVYIGAGLLALMDSEDELGAVLGHEIEHIDHYHCAERAQRQQAIRKIPLGELFALPIEVFEAGYSKDQELEADREGTRLSVQTGYSPTGAIRMFETFERLYREYHERPHTPQGELSQVAAGTLEGYFRTHPLASERIAQINNLIASEGWTAHSERDLAVAYIFWATEAGDALAEGDFAKAQQLAARSLENHAGYPTALIVRGEAKFDQADFAGAAASYRELLDAGVWVPAVCDSYAQSLAAAEGKNAAGEFQKWMATAKGDKQQMRTELAGLFLLAGEAGPAKARREEIVANIGDPSAASDLADLGWWSYMAGDYAAAADLLEQARQLRPNNSQIGVRLAWTEIELRQFANALALINGADDANTPQAIQSELTMARAVVRWQTQQRNAALADFERATRNQKQWLNSRWVKALYSPLVTASVQELQDERDRRKKTAAPKRS